MRYRWLRYGRWRRRRHDQGASGEAVAARQGLLPARRRRRRRSLAGARHGGRRRRRWCNPEQRPAQICGCSSFGRSPSSGCPRRRWGSGQCWLGRRLSRRLRLPQPVENIQIIPTVIAHTASLLRAPRRAFPYCASSNSSRECSTTSARYSWHRSDPRKYSTSASISDGAAYQLGPLLARA